MWRVLWIVFASRNKRIFEREFEFSFQVKVYLPSVDSTAYVFGDTAWLVIGPTLQLLPLPFNESEPGLKVRGLNCVVSEIMELSISVRLRGINLLIFR